MTGSMGAAAAQFEIERLQACCAEYRETIAKQQDTLEEQAEWQKEREGAEHYGPFGANCMNTGQFDAGECWLCYAKRKKQEAAEMQLVAGRYQYMHEQAQKALNKIDDLFEYAYEFYQPLALQSTVQGHLMEYTEAVAKIPK